MRTAREPDFDRCREFEYEHVPEEWLRQCIQNGWTYIAEAEGTFVGYARLEFIWLHLPYPSLISVDEAHRRHGFGSAMIDHIAEELAAKGHRALYSSSEVMAPAAQAFHRHCGFRECGIIAGMNEGGVGEVFFVKSLAERG